MIADAAVTLGLVHGDERINSFDHRHPPHAECGAGCLVSRLPMSIADAAERLCPGCREIVLQSE